MAGYRVPTFNLWCKVYRFDNTIPVPAYLPVGYSKCQLRGIDSHLDAGPITTLQVEVLFPAGSDIRSNKENETGKGDVIQIGGYGEMRWIVNTLSDKGAGFLNEYRIAVTSPFPPVAPAGLPRVNPELVPPVGYTPLPVLTPGLVWF